MMKLGNVVSSQEPSKEEPTEDDEMWSELIDMVVSDVSVPEMKNKFQITRK